MLTFFLAGHETTAGTLTWAMLELTRHPAAMQQLVREVDEVYAASGIGSGGKTELDVDDMGKFKYMTQVLKASSFATLFQCKHSRRHVICLLLRRCFVCTPRWIRSAAACLRALDWQTTLCPRRCASCLSKCLL